MADDDHRSGVVALPAYPNVQRGESSVSGLSSGAFMAVQLHLAYSSSFCGAGIIAGGPYRCAETFPAAAPVAKDADLQTAWFLCMRPLIAQTGPNASHLAQLARDTARDGQIDPVENLAGDRIYLFTGSKDTVVDSTIVARTREFYRLLGVRDGDIAYHDTVPAGHAIITENPEDAPLGVNRPPYINRGPFTQSHEILRHLYGDLKPPSAYPGGRLLRFDQRPFTGGDARASMSPFGYVYVPDAVQRGAPARVHVVLHGCKQGYSYVPRVYGRPDTANQAPYGRRFVATTGYNEIADSNGIIVLYPQAEPSGGASHNPDGCWDWWGYTGTNPKKPDYYSRDAIQIKAIHAMLRHLGG